MYKYIVQKNRLKRFPACLSVLTMIVGIWLVTWISIPSVYADENKQQNSYAAANGVNTKKTVTANDDGSYTITLESYTTGKVTQKTTSAPIDFVLVLDQSASMSSNNLGSVTRQQAMINAINGTDSNKGFVDIISEKSNEQADNRVAIVTFSNSAQTVMSWTFVKGNENTIKNKVSSLSASGLTDTAAGMNHASTLLDNLDYTGKNTKRQKVVIFLSDGIARTGSMGFDSDNANSAVAEAKTLKDKGVTIYTIGIFEGVNSALTYPTKDGAGNMISENTEKWYDKWIPSSSLDSRLFEFLEPAIGNRFCNYLSSNYLSASTLGIKGEKETKTKTNQKRGVVTVDTNYTRDSDQYFLTADDTDALADIFQTITEQVSAPEIDLGSETVLQDVITPYFSIKNGSNVKVYTANADVSTLTDDKWMERVEDTSLSLSNIDGNTIRVTGFDYNANFVSETPKADGSYGRKLIVEFTVIPSANFLGGTVATNETENSGLILTDDEGNESIIQNFIPLPEYVSVPLKEIKPKDAEWNIYLTTEDQLIDKFKNLTFTIDNNKAYFENLFNTINNAGVNVSFLLKNSEGNEVYEFTVQAGEMSENWTKDMPADLSDTHYTLICKVEDKDDKSLSKTNTADVEINVYKPVLTFENMNVYYGGQVNLSEVKPAAVQWMCGETTANPSDMNTNPPTLKVTQVTPADTGKINADGYVSVADDFSVDAEVEVGNQTLSFPNAFKIHVNTVSLSIRKLVEGQLADKTKEFSFTVTVTHDNLENYRYNETFNLADNGEKKLTGLPINAKFKIVENNVPNGYKVYFNSSENESTNRTITGTLSDDLTAVKVTNKLDTVPQTGIDDGNLLLVYSIILFSGIGLITLRIFSRRKNNKYCGKHFV